MITDLLQGGHMGGRKDEFRRALCRAETAPIATAETYSKNSAFTMPENKVKHFTTGLQGSP